MSLPGAGANVGAGARAGRAVPARLLAVWAHPDDESYLSAGLMQRVVARGGSVRVVTATLGEAGFADDDPRPARARAALRERELRAALGVLGVRDVHVLGVPDGGCAAVDEDDAAREVAGHMTSFRPDAVVSFGPDGLTGHPDHVAVSRWTSRAWRRRRCGALLHAALTRGHLDEFAELNARFGVFYGDAPGGAREHDLALAVDLSAGEMERKRAALAAHASQTAGLARAMGEQVFRRWTRRETFVAAPAT